MNHNRNKIAEKWSRLFASINHTKGKLILTPEDAQELIDDIQGYEDNIRKFIEEETKEINGFIVDRAKDYKEDLTEDDKDDLLSIDMDCDILTSYDKSDLEYHSFELGLGRAYYNIKNIL